jgi:dTDP-4-dehydrorhamnose reductase
MLATSDLQVWAGVECARVRIGDGICDELDLTGHAARPEDLDRLASLGVTAARYPVLWERTEVTPDSFDWHWADERMARFRELRIEPVVGLLHHGAGPAWTSYLDPRFPTRFARYARAFAERFPEVERYLPVNEPLTTARFAALYGFWWPHARDWRTFARILLAQVLATRAAMEAIREVNANAILIANEDLGRTYSTRELADQATADNERRWLTFDLLCGRVVPGHPFRARLARAGLGRALRSLAARPCPPDLLGVDYYVTSDRFLDHRVELYPGWARTANQSVAYADVEAVRSTHDWTCGFGRVIDEAWERYRTPLALTEVQLAAEPEDQIAWWTEAWHRAVEARAAGRDVRAVTAWSAFGAWEWNSLLLRRDGVYEPGAFDSRDDPPSETPLADAIRRTAAPAGTRDGAARTLGGTPKGAGGWWTQPERVLYGLAARAPAADSAPSHP